MNADRVGTSKIVLISLIAVTVLSCFVQSLMPPAVSSEESSTVADIIALIFSTDTPFGAFVVNNIRKIAHFCEYGLIGVELAIYSLLYTEDKRRAAISSLAFAHAVAFVDESLQILSKRGPSIADVWLDSFGFVTFYLLTVGTAFAIKKIKIKGNKNG